MVLLGLLIGGYKEGEVATGSLGNGTDVGDGVSSSLLSSSFSSSLRKSRSAWMLLASVTNKPAPPSSTVLTAVSGLEAIVALVKPIGSGLEAKASPTRPS